MAGIGDLQLDRAFCDAMRRLAATVNIITISDGGTAMGMTATAVSSLAADPPSLLVCVNQSASMHNALATADRFCVNILHHDQVDVAQIFSDRSARDVRFSTGRWERDGEQPPRLEDAQASLLCDRTQLIAFGTHTICIGVVREVRTRADVNPLVYVDGRFTAVADG